MLSTEVSTVGLHSRFTTELRYVSSQKNVVADALSIVESLAILDYDAVPESQADDEE